MSELQKPRHGLEAFMATLPAQVADKNAGVIIQIQPEFESINLRGDPQNAEFVASVASTLGQALPDIANTMTVGSHRVFWLGPNEWQIMTSSIDPPGLLARLSESLSGQHACVTDVSGGLVSFQLAGPAARDILARGCTLDLHINNFRLGSCAQSGLAKANVLIGLIDDAPSFQIVVRRSFAEYLALWLQAAASEYGVQFTTS